MGIIADIDDPALAALPVVNENPSARKLYRITAELCYLLHPEPTAEHEGEECPISRACYDPREPGNLLIAQVPRQRPWEPQGIASFYGIGYRYPLLSSQVLIEPSDAVQVAVDGLGPEPPGEKMVDILEDLPGGYLFDGDIDPDHELFQGVHIGFHRMR